MSLAKSIVDSEGNINASFLTKELQDALEEDVKFKQTDNMKKRAVKVSTDYNEFKNMVACAHLKKLTSKEVESLSHVKKGWQKSVAHDTSSSALILTKEFEKDQLLAQNSDIKKAFRSTDVKVSPKSAMELERDLRRIGTSEEKLLYLYQVGLKRIKNILSSGGDTDLLEQVVNILCHNKVEVLRHHAEKSAAFDKVQAVGNAEGLFDCVPSESQEVEQYSAAEKQAATPSPEGLLLDLKLRTRWLKAISEFEKFDLMVQFSSQALLTDVVQFLSVFSGPSTITAKAKYQQGIKLLI